MVYVFYKLCHKPAYNIKFLNYFMIIFKIFRLAKRI